MSGLFCLSLTGIMSGDYACVLPFDVQSLLHVPDHKVSGSKSAFSKVPDSRVQVVDMIFLSGSGFGSDFIVHDITGQFGARATNSAVTIEDEDIFRIELEKQLK